LTNCVSHVDILNKKGNCQQQTELISAPKSKYQMQSCYQVLPSDNHQQQKDLLSVLKTATISGSDDVSSPRQQLSAAMLLSVIPNRNYQQQCCYQ